MLPALSRIDQIVIFVYLAAMLWLGYALSVRKSTEEDYFLGNRKMPWFAVGVSVIASLLSSLTYLSEPGEVWKSGVTHMTGKMLAIPLEMLIVWVFCIPFIMSFHYTSAYEYLEDRYGRAARRTGVVLFVAMVVLWMGFVVFASAQALTAVAFYNQAGTGDTYTNNQLFIVIGTIGVVATIYTMLGGMRAVIWTDVVQVAILVGGGLATIGFVAWKTGTWLPDWYANASAYLTRSGRETSIPLFSADPKIRATVVTVALHMCVWHVCTHVANQMTVQRYFSTPDPKAARRSFVTGSLLGVGLNLMLMVVGLAVLSYYVAQHLPLDRGLSAATKDRDLIFPTFAVSHLPPGVGGAILAALLAAAMSSIDSGINSIATVLTIEIYGRRAPAERGNHVQLARTITFVAGAFITVAACSLTYLPQGWGIVDAMPRTFNAITAPLGGLFLAGIFMPWLGQRAALAAVFCGMATSLGLGYLKQIGHVLDELGLIRPTTWDWIESGDGGVSAFWIMPSALVVTLVTAAFFGAILRDPPRDLSRLTWYTRKR